MTTIGRDYISQQPWEHFGTIRVSWWTIVFTISPQHTKDGLQHGANITQAGTVGYLPVIVRGPDSEGTPTC